MKRADLAIAALGVIAALATSHGLEAAGAEESQHVELAEAAPATPGMPGRLTIRGRVSDVAGLAIPAVQVFLEGAQREIASVDRNGYFALQLPVGPLDRLIRSPLALWLNARRSGWRIGLASGAPRLRIEVRAYDDSLGARHVLVRTNDSAATAALAGAFADGTFADTLEIAFAGEPGRDPEPSDLAMDAEADVVVIPGRITSYGAPDSAASGSAPVRVAAPPPAIRDSRPAPVDTTSSWPAPTADRAPTLPTNPPRTSPAEACTCRVEGTIEVQWDHPLPERAPVAVWIEGKPAARDSVELLLGSPRGFNLQASGCGTHRVAYKVHSRLRFRRLTPEPVIECTGNELRQLRIVLEPVRPRTRR